ncbi:heme ABC exporter ATP-binding protein CcmA, partial [Dysosmobacter welbionis]
AIHNCVVGVVLVVGVLDLLAAGLEGEEDHVVVAAGDLVVILVHAQVHDGGNAVVAAVVAHVDGIGSNTAIIHDGGSVVDAGVGTVIGVLPIIGAASGISSHHEHRLAVGIDVVGALLGIGGVGHALVSQVDPGHAVPQLEGIDSRRNLGVLGVEILQAILAVGGLLHQDNLRFGFTNLQLRTIASEVVGVVLLGVDGLHLAVIGDQSGLVRGESNAGTLQSAQIGVVSDVVLSLLDVDGIAVGIQVHDILAVDAQAALAAVHRIHLGEVILGLTQVDGLAGNLSGQSALSGLSSLDRLDLVVGIGEEDDLVVLETSGLELVVGTQAGGGAVLSSQLGQGDVSILGVGLGHNLVDLSHVGVDSHDGDIVGILIQIGLDQSAVADVALRNGRVGELQLADLQVVALGDLGGLVSLNAVHEDGSGLILVGHAQVRVDLAQLHVGGVGGVSGLGEGANLNALEAPGVGGTAEVIGGVGGQAQVGEVSLSELHLVVVVD